MCNQAPQHAATEIASPTSQWKEIKPLDGGDKYFVNTLTGESSFDSEVLSSTNEAFVEVDEDSSIEELMMIENMDFGSSEDSDSDEEAPCAKIQVKNTPGDTPRDPHKVLCED